MNLMSKCVQDCFEEAREMDDEEMFEFVRKIEDEEAGLLMVAVALVYDVDEKPKLIDGKEEIA